MGTGQIRCDDTPLFDTSPKDPRGERGETTDRKKKTYPASIPQRETRVKRPRKKLSDGAGKVSLQGIVEKKEKGRRERSAQNRREIS